MGVSCSSPAAMTPLSTQKLLPLPCVGQNQLNDFQRSSTTMAIPESAEPELQDSHLIGKGAEAEALFAIAIYDGVRQG